MERQLFHHRLIQATELCHEFTKTLVVDHLPPFAKYRVLLNCSYDQNPLILDETIFPNDAEFNLIHMKSFNADEVMELLWRDEKIPEWIDINIFHADLDATYYELRCCGRFTSQEQLLYYKWTDIAPFGIKGPPIPNRLVKMSTDGITFPKFLLAESYGNYES